MMGIKWFLENLKEKNNNNNNKYRFEINKLFLYIISNEIFYIMIK